MRNLFRIFTISSVLLIFISSCKKNDLNLRPTNDLVADQAYATPAGYKNQLVKLYASYALTHSSGATGESDIGGLNPGFTDFLRLFWMSQELPTDEAICGWNDEGIPELNKMTWTSENIFIRGLYSRSIYQITVCNDFLRESTPEKLASRGITGADATNVQRYRAEARFLRAFQYWVLLDGYGNPPFVTENDLIGKVPPIQIQRAELFKYVESELKAIEVDLAEPRDNEYGRADKGADWSLLARLYLNAEVYTGTARYTDAITYASKVINSGYALSTVYKNLFLTDSRNTSKENILTINYDGLHTQNDGGTTYLINAAINGDMKPAEFGVPTGGWGGNRSRINLPQLFTDYSGATDKRALFFGVKLENDDANTFTDGLRVVKFRNVDSKDVPAPSIEGKFSSLDFALFRLAEQYLIYGEAVTRGGTGGTAEQALKYVNGLRQRAYGNTSGNVSSLSVDFFLDERGRELYWEGFRRTDLIRYKKFTEGGYLWPFKGGAKSGIGVAATRNLYPLPLADMIANTNLVQNPGY
ncbi:RagB/SusD family nutrient uptake outer membrane protein [Pedobacter gandavensis]|uniref:RagB/SusD family nutrient uptake outer membrane protein n=1 Tax=Pedobacter gandavensis TaxID=2679963 RepID=UPI0029305104|nr:RagB/SusD family nutrient uptake outer membrane protein [Pedobacter gandavensis]